MGYIFSTSLILVRPKLKNLEKVKRYNSSLQEITRQNVIENAKRETVDYLIFFFSLFL